ncbi:MAG: hypothetical protein D6816_17035 [Bacteroidetes bacterium]|nr:MAG: hypothetical protein D6816_17035 [Bacteroidota bacterium]
MPEIPKVNLRPFAISSNTQERALSEVRQPFFVDTTAISNQLQQLRQVAQQRLVGLVEQEAEAAGISASRDAIERERDLRAEAYASEALKAASGQESPLLKAANGEMIDTPEGQKAFDLAFKDPTVRLADLLKSEDRLIRRVGHAKYNATLRNAFALETATTLQNQFADAFQAFKHDPTKSTTAFISKVEALRTETIQRMMEVDPTGRTAAAVEELTMPMFAKYVSAAQEERINAEEVAAKERLDQSVENMVNNASNELSLGGSDPAEYTRVLGVTTQAIVSKLSVGTIADQQRAGEILSDTVKKLTGSYFLGNFVNTHIKTIEDARKSGDIVRYNAAIAKAKQHVEDLRNRTLNMDEELAGYQFPFTEETRPTDLSWLDFDAIATELESRIPAQVNLDQSGRIQLDIDSIEDIVYGTIERGGTSIPPSAARSPLGGFPAGYSSEDEIPLERYLQDAIDIAKASGAPLKPKQVNRLTDLLVAVRNVNDFNRNLNETLKSILEEVVPDNPAEARTRFQAAIARGLEDPKSFEIIGPMNPRAQKAIVARLEQINAVLQDPDIPAGDFICHLGVQGASESCNWNVAADRAAKEVKASSQDPINAKKTVYAQGINAAANAAAMRGDKGSLPTSYAKTAVEGIMQIKDPALRRQEVAALGVAMQDVQEFNPNFSFDAALRKLRSQGPEGQAIASAIVVAAAASERGLPADSANFLVSLALQTTGERKEASTILENVASIANENDAKRAQLLGGFLSGEQVQTLAQLEMLADETNAVPGDLVDAAKTLSDLFMISTGNTFVAEQMALDLVRGAVANSVSAVARNRDSREVADALFSRTELFNDIASRTKDMIEQFKVRSVELDVDEARIDNKVLIPSLFAEKDVPTPNSRRRLVSSSIQDASEAILEFIAKAETPEAKRIAAILTSREFDTKGKKPFFVFEQRTVYNEMLQRNVKEMYLVLKSDRGIPLAEARVFEAVPGANASEFLPKSAISKTIRVLGPNIRMRP